MWPLLSANHSILEPVSWSVLLKQSLTAFSLIKLFLWLTTTYWRLPRLLYSTSKVVCTFFQGPNMLFNLIFPFIDSKGFFESLCNLICDLACDTKISKSQPCTSAALSFHGFCVWRWRDKYTSNPPYVKSGGDRNCSERIGLKKYCYFADQASSMLTKLVVTKIWTTLVNTLIFFHDVSSL